MTYAATLAAFACFAVALHRCKVLSVARRAVQTGLDAARVMRDADLTDRDKEQSVRAASLVLVRCFGSIVVRSAVAVAASLVPLLALDFAGLVRLSAVNDLLMSWTGALIAAGGTALMLVGRPRQ